jgi:hypothetical protein
MSEALGPFVNWQEFSELNNSLASSVYGLSLRECPRYGLFIPDGMTAAEWVSILDSDVNNFEHNALTAGLADIICQIEGVGEDVRYYTVATAAIHDLGEHTTSSKKDGDTVFGLKAEDDDHEEYAFLVAEAKAGRMPISVEHAELASAVMEDSKRDQPLTEEGRLFALTERIGYLRTALIAYREYTKLSPDDNHVLRHNLMWLWSDVLSNSYEWLKDRHPQHLAIQAVLEDNRVDIENMFKITAANIDSLERSYAGASQRGRRFDVPRQMGKITSAISSHRSHELV